LAQPHQEHVHKVLLVAFTRADVDLRVLEDFATEANVPGLKVLSPPPPSFFFVCASWKTFATEVNVLGLKVIIPPHLLSRPFPLDVARLNPLMLRASTPLLRAPLPGRPHLRE
jgi:hypothetical protein